MATNALANGIRARSASSRITTTAQPILLHTSEWPRAPLMLEQKNGINSNPFSDFLRSGDLTHITGRDLQKIDEAIMSWVERIEDKYSRRRESGVIEGKALEKLSETFHFFANILTANNLHIEPFGISWSKNSLADKVEADLLDSSSLISRLDVLQPFRDIENIVRCDIEDAINRTIDRARKDGTYSEEMEGKLRDDAPGMTALAALQTRRALAIMYLTGIVPEVVKGFEINGAVFGDRILLAQCEENPSWEEKYTPWHEAVHLHVKKGLLKVESPLTYAMNYLPLLMEKNPKALEKARSAGEFRPEDLLLSDLDPSAREAGLALAVRMMDFCEKMMGEATASIEQILPVRQQNKDAFVVYFVQRYLGHLAQGVNPDDTEKQLYIYAKSMSYLLEAKRARAEKVVMRDPSLKEAVDILYSILVHLPDKLSFEQIEEGLEPGGQLELMIRENGISTAALETVRGLVNCCADSTKRFCPGQELRVTNRMFWRLFGACHESLLAGAKVDDITAHVARLVRMNEGLRKIKAGEFFEMTDPFATTMLVMDYTEKNRPSDKPLSLFLLYLHENREELVDAFSHLNRLSGSFGEMIRLSGVNEALRMIEFCCRQARRVHGTWIEELMFFKEYWLMLSDGMMPSVIESRLNLEVECDLRVAREVKREQRKRA